MIPENIKEKLKNNFKSFNVIPFDMPKLNKMLDEYIKNKYSIEDGEFFNLQRDFALIKDTDLIIDSECICEPLKAGKLVLELYAERQINQKVVDFDLLPRYTFFIPIEKLINEFSLSETTLETFMSEKFGYNFRIINNMHSIRNLVAINS